MTLTFGLRRSILHLRIEIWGNEHLYSLFSVPCSKNMRMASHILHRNKEEKHFNDLWWPWPLTLGYEIFTKIFFFVMWAICVHELNRIWAFSLDENHFEIYKVMTLTFELENGNHTYLIKLWYILYLNTKFGGCSLKVVLVAKI